MFDQLCPQGGRAANVWFNGRHVVEERLDGGTVIAAGGGLFEGIGNKGNKEFIAWQGGCFEAHWSVNPHWTANFTKLPKHPITQGVKPFKQTTSGIFTCASRRG